MDEAKNNEVKDNSFDTASVKETKSQVEDKIGDTASDNNAGVNTGEKSGTSQKKKKKKKSTGRLAAEFFIKLIVTALAIWALCTFVIGIYIVHSNSGYPMLKDGDLCIIYRLGELHSGDEVAYLEGGKIRFGRIAAMPGDEVTISEENLSVNGYGVFEDTVYPTTGEGALISFPYTVPEKAYFILNDYRSDVTDSRSYGAIAKKNIKGKVIFVMRRRGI
ncbi:signal peptidase I [Eubacterium ruminantium]|nr:signal peptidase I [Eubacterium ruminantium]